ncbi:MAG: hypothetical protein Q9169_003732 [Polycauliona sp. 2 TL-2023]
MGAMDKKTIFAVLSFYKDQGGNFLDAATTYQNEQSEIWIGEWLASKPGLRGFDGIVHANTTGNGTKSLNLSLEASFKKLQTHYIDILFVHWWDFTTSIPGLMQSLNTVCDQGKVLYLGISDTPAWIVSKANEYASAKGLRQFIASCAGVPSEAATSRRKEQREAVAGKGRNVASPRENHVKCGAQAYVLHKAPYVFPIVGGRKIEHLLGNIEALSVELSTEDLLEIEGAVDFDPGFPLNFISPMAKNGGKGPVDIPFTDMSGKFDYVQGPYPIRPYQAS